MQAPDSMTSASAYFNTHWQRYQSSVENNTLYHREMLTALAQFLSTHLHSHPFSFVDVGCGDSSTVAPILLDQPISKYIGIDAAKDVLKLASHSLASLSCEKEFIAENMTTAIQRIALPVDIIFTSYAVHHLSLQEKENFIASCKDKLKPNGFLLMVDGVLQENQTRQAWLDTLQERIRTTIPNISLDEVHVRMQHPCADDFPESLATFTKIAQQQGWQDFQVLVDKGIFAFMVFAR